MIAANMATYPARRGTLMRAVASIAPQVDRLNLVLNEYDAVPEELSAIPNVVPIIPETDLKDVGKFYPDVSGASHVFLVDDDIAYPPDFVALSLARYRALGLGRALAGYHCSVYRRPPLRPTVKALRALGRFYLSPDHIARFRDYLHFGVALEEPVYVDQVATNAALMAARDLPPFAFMQGSQKFVDVRLARWCHEQGIACVCLPREAGWLAYGQLDEGIVRGFTSRHFAHVAAEIRAYAFKDRRSGQAVGPAGGRAAAAD